MENTYVIEDRIIVSIYKKTSELSSEDYEQILDYFNELYPDVKTIYKDRVEYFLSKP